MGCNRMNREEVMDSIFMDYDHGKIPYKLYQPAGKVKLHYDLEEISGLSYYKDGLLAAVEDERGKVYFLDAETGEIKRKIKFSKAGDYEGIEIEGEHIHVMKSNGMLYDFEITDDNKPVVQISHTGLTSKNNIEGLGMVNGNLLIALKGDAQVGDAEVKGKGIYLYNFEELIPFLFIENKAVKNHLDKRKFFKSAKNFDPSAIAIRPVNGDIYILSGDHVLVVYNSELKLKEIVKLNRKLFNQPEGMCFSPDGKLYISSEGDGNRGALFVFATLSID
jgi:uncharacterized protein YjiK